MAPDCSLCQAGRFDECPDARQVMEIAGQHDRDLATVRRIRQGGRRHPDGCLDMTRLGVGTTHLRDEAYSDEELLAVLVTRTAWPPPDWEPC
jgi:hypothetical protein